jgi:hypothetical protein
VAVGADVEGVVGRFSGAGIETPSGLNDIKLFLPLQTSGLYYKTSMIIIYDHNDSGQYYKTTITIVYLWF